VGSAKGHTCDCAFELDEEVVEEGVDGSAGQHEDGDVDYPADSKSHQKYARWQNKLIGAPCEGNDDSTQPKDELGDGPTQTNK